MRGIEMDKEIIEVKYSHKTITGMRAADGIFNKERLKLKKHKLNEPLRYRVFKPIIPENMSMEDLKTLVDLAIFSGCYNMVLPETQHINGLRRRAAIYHLSIEEERREMWENQRD